MKVKTQPELNYVEGNATKGKLDLSKLVVELTDKNGNKQDVPFDKLGEYGITTNPKNGTELTVDGNNGKPVVLTKGELTANTDNLVVTKDNTTDPVIPFEPKDPEKPGDKDDPNIPTVNPEDNKPIKRDEYVVVGFKVDPKDSGTLTLGEQANKAVISALVKKDTEWAKFTMPTTKDGNDYVFWHWDKAPADKVADGQVRVATFIKSGDEINPNDTNPLPKDFHKVTVAKGTGIADNALFGKTYAVKKGDTLAQAKFPELKVTDAKQYKDPAWDVKDPWTVAVEDKDLTFTAKAEKIVIEEDKTKAEYPKTEIEKGKTEIVTPNNVTDKDGNPVPKDKVGTPTITNKNELPNGVIVTPKENGKVEVTVPDNYNGPKDIKVKVTVPVDGKNVDSEIDVIVKEKTTPTPQKPSVTYPDTNIDKGETKKVTPNIKDKDGKTTTPDTTPKVSQPGHGLIVTPNKDGSIDVTVPKDYDGPDTITVDVTVKVNGEDIKTTLTIRVNNGNDDGDYVIPGIKIRDHYTPTYPVYASVPDKGTKVIDTLWYIFHIDKYDYEEIRNKNSTSHKMDVTPVIRNERTMLPLRYVAEAIGADVKWDPETRTATFAKDGLIATIQIDSDEIVLSNGKTVKMDSKPLNINDRILVSVVNVGNVFGLTNGNTLDGVDQDIEWDHDTRTATIYIRR